MQKTIQKEISFSGRGLHTGSEVTVVLKPAKVNTGIIFKRVDLPNQPLIKPSFENISIDDTVPRCTSIYKGDAVIHTVEHFMAALFGFQIDNILVEIDGDELPGLDGSGINFLGKIKAVGVCEQEEEREYITIHEPVSVHHKDSSILIVPADELKVSYALNYDHPYLKAQFFSGVINQETFEKEIAPCRTFCLEEEAKELQSSGLGKGANYENTLVVGAKGVIDNEERFPDEFARHRVLDFIGDMYLLGKPLKGQVFAVRSGHRLNIELLQKIIKQQEQYKKKGALPRYDYGDFPELDIQKIMDILPHRYPFLLVDRIIELEKGKKAIGIKNVTINDNFFTGHFPAKPIMPGVLMVEAMAQVGGVLVLTSGMHNGKVALFLATDKVKFRKLVEPGDQLHMTVELVRDRPRSASLKGTARVAGDIVAEAEMIFSFLDAEFLIDQS